MNRCGVWYGLQGARRMLLVVLAVVIVAGAASCATTGGNWMTTAEKIASPEQASKYYVVASHVFEDTMNALITLRAAHKIDDATWRQVELYRDNIGVGGQKVGTAVKLWRAGAGKAFFDRDWNQLVIDISGLQKLYSGVK